MVTRMRIPLPSQDHQVHEQDEHKSVFSSFGWAEEAQENEIHQEGGLIGPVHSASSLSPAGTLQSTSALSDSKVPGHKGKNL